MIMSHKFISTPKTTATTVNTKRKKRDASTQITMTVREDASHIHTSAYERRSCWDEDGKS